MALSEAAQRTLAFKKCIIKHASFMKLAPALQADFSRDNITSSVFLNPTP